MGLRVSVYRSRGMDCTMDGVSKFHDNLVVVNAEGPFDPDREDAAVLLVDDRPTGTPYPKLVPAEWDDEKGEWVRCEGWYMAGGNYGGTCDSRYKAEGMSHGILPIHDRREW